MGPSRNQTTNKERDNWEKTSIIVEILHKIFILIIGSAVAGIFYVYQQQQVESRYFADLMAQRESAESQLRAQMFKTLFDAYFANKLQAKAGARDEPTSERGVTGVGIATTPASIDPQLERLRQEAIFIDLLARNFENIDVRPLFEDLDLKVSELLNSAGKASPLGSVTSNEARREIFALREQLRRVAIGASSRQTAALEGGANAKVKIHEVKWCTGEQPAPKPPFSFLGVTTLIDKMKDGAVIMRIVPDSQTTQPEPIYLQVSFYDMPSLENIVLPGGERVAFSLARYLSHDSCSEFIEQLDESIRTDCPQLLSEKQACNVAWIRTIVFPKDYIAARERPHYSDLIAGRFRR